MCAPLAHKNNLENTCADEKYFILLQRFSAEMAQLVEQRIRNA